MTAQAKAGLDITQWETNITKMISSAGRADNAVKDLTGSIDTLETRLRGIASQNLSLELDLNVGGVGEFEDFIKRINDQESSTLKLDIDVDETELQALKRKLESLQQSLEVDLDVDESDIQGLKSAIDLIQDSIDVMIDVDESQIDSAETKIKNLDNLDPKVTVDVDESEVKSLPALIDAIDRVVELEIDIGGVLGRIAGALTEPITNLGEIDRLIKKIEGSAKQAIPNSKELILDLWVNGWGGKSRTDC